MKNFVRAATAALSYTAVIFGFQYLFDLQNTNIRIATFLAPLFGIMWGPAGAIGIGVGNFAADLIWKNSLSAAVVTTSTFGAFGNALIAFLSYILWHAAFLRNKEDNPFVISIRNIIRYIGIQIIVAVVTSLYFTMIVKLADWFDSAWDFFFIVMLNNCEVTIFLSLPVLLMLMSIDYDFYAPTNKFSLKINGKFFDVLLILLTAAAAVLASLDMQTFDEIANYRRILAAFFFIYLLRPVPEFSRVNSEIPHPIYYRVAKGFCIFMVALTAVLSIDALTNMSGNYSSDKAWLEFYTGTFWILHFTLIIQLVLIGYIEINIVKPLTKITETAAAFTHSDPEKEKISFEVVPSGDEIELLSRTLKKMLDSIYKYIEDLRRTLSEKAKTQTQLDIARNIQASLLPPTEIINSEFETVHVDALMEPALTVGGDFYDFKPLDEDHIFLVCSDISDKGISASLFMTITYTLIHHKISLAKNFSLMRVFAETNNQLCENNETGMFATAVGVVYEISTGKLIYVNAGHTSPLIVHKDGSTEFLKKRSGPMLGSIEDIPYKKLETNLSSGDILILYSDGVSEALNESEDFFLEERLAAVVSQFVAENRTDDISLYIRKKVAEFVGTHPQSDDITIVALFIK